MRLLITGADGRLARAVMAALHDGASVVAVDRRISAPLPDGVEAREGDIRDPELMPAVLEGVAAVLHLAPLAMPAGDDLTALDEATRGTYVLFTHALDAGVRRFVLRPAYDFGDCAAVHGSSPPTAPPQGQSLPEVVIPRSPQPARPLRRIVIFGAGGPLAAAAVVELAGDHRLRLTDARPIEAIAAEGPRRDQPAGAPVPEPLGAPHEQHVVDVTDAAQVSVACAGMDAIVNCTVIRNDLAGAFRVNTLGAYNIARAAVEHGIRRIVQTGPQLATLHEEHDYTQDYDIAVEAPPRPGRHLYAHSKYLGHEIMRVFADYYGLEVPVLLFNQLAQPDAPQAQALDPFAVSWRDAARAIRRAIEVAALPQPYEVLNVGADLPHGRFNHRRVKEILGWQAQDDMRHLWSVPDRRI